MPPRLKVSFNRGGKEGIILLGSAGGRPELPVEGLHLSSGLEVLLYEEDGIGPNHGELLVDSVVAGWNELHQCWFAKFQWDALRWTPVPVWEGVAIISFDEWVRRVFAHDVSEPSWWWKEATDWDLLPPPIALDYMSRLFEESSKLPRLYPDTQVGQGLWFLIGSESDHARCLLDLGLAWPIRLRCIRSILRLFEFFMTRCSPHLSHLNEPSVSPLNSICYMFWDILPIHGTPDSSALAELDSALLTVMTDIATAL
jgi:hypothetical protein